MADRAADQAASSADADERHDDEAVQAQLQHRQHLRRLVEADTRVQRDRRQARADRQMHRKADEQDERRHDQESAADPHESGDDADRKPFYTEYDAIYER